tara:strand:+ start:552 stop:719 length:168 start_codon:yes stop_codon:yes gene_type:complete
MPTLEEKFFMHDFLMEKHNKTGKSPMELDDTPEGQEMLRKICKLVAHDMQSWEAK